MGRVSRFNGRRAMEVLKPQIPFLSARERVGADNYAGNIRIITSKEGVGFMEKYGY